MDKTFGQVAYEARFEHMPQREWTPWADLKDPVVTALWQKVGLAVQMAVTERRPR